MIKNAQEFVTLRTSTRQEDYLRAATEPAALEVWGEIIQTFPDMKVWVAHNKTVPIPILRILASDSDTRVRHFVATKNKLPEDLLMLLAGDADESVRHRIAYNKNARSEILEKLAGDPSELVSSAARQRLQLLEQKRRGNLE